MGFDWVSAGIVFAVMALGIPTLAALLTLAFHYLIKGFETRPGTLLIVLIFLLALGAAIIVGAGGGVR